MITLPDVKIVGTLTADPVLRFIPTGKAVANFSIACNERKLNKDTGQWENGDATFVRCNIWGEYAENVAESLTKGIKVIAFGSLKQRSYDKDGVKQTVFELEVEEIGPTLRFASARVQGGARTGGSSQQPAAAAPADDPWGSAPSDAPAWA